MYYFFIIIIGRKFMIIANFIIGSQYIPRWLS